MLCFCTKVISGFFSPYEELDKLKMVTKSQEEQIISLKAVTKSQKEQITSLDTKVGELKNNLEREIEQVEREIQEVNVNRAEASFKFELADVSKFFEIESNKRCSDKFWCRGLQWSIKVQRKLKAEDGSKQLEVYLHSENDDQFEWSCKTNFKLILFNNLPEKKNLIYGPTLNTFKLKSGFGFSNFISYSKLIDEKNGYIKDDKIVLGVELKVEPVFRK